MAAADRVADWTALVHDCYPAADAAGWDSVGLQVGDPEDLLDTVAVCLDVTDATLDEAAQSGAGLLIAHHPLLFRPLARLTPDTAAGRLALRAARQRTAILAVHTNLDVAVAGTTEPVTGLLDLRDVRPLQPQADGAGDVKLVTFVPTEHTGEVVSALAAAGAGVIGEYDHCTFRVAGTGTFRPSAAANPAVGVREQRNEVAEDRVEVVVPQPRIGQVVAALRAGHPYEEVAYDLYPLLARPQDATKGLGRVGDLPQPMRLRTVADRLAVGLDTRHLRVVGDLDREVRRVAACGGAGDSLIGAALGQGADVYVTGDLRHHVSLDAATMGMALIDAGHYATEAAALPSFMATLEQAARKRGLQARLLASTQRTEPWADYRAP